jgi:hypothetical protein
LQHIAHKYKEMAVKNPTRQEITDQNENLTHDWFELSDFRVERLDKPGNNNKKAPDWKSTKENVTVYCEVKTIFSGGQQKLTPEQYERQRATDEQYINEAKAKLPEGQPLIVPSNYLEYLGDKTPRRTESINKEDAYQKFEEEIDNRLVSDAEIAHAPFRLTISIDGLYIPPAKLFTEFMSWLKGYILWAQQNHNSERIHSTSTFTFQPIKQLADGSYEHSIEAFVQMMGPYTVDALNVGFIRGGVPYHEQNITKNIERAMTQLPKTPEDDANSVATVALWSESSYLSFSQVLIGDVIEAQLGRIGSRYYLFDWAFSQYPHLAAIILFELRPKEPPTDFWEYLTNPTSDLLPFGCVITNPFLPNHERVLRQNISERFAFIKGIDKDPLTNNQIDRGS